ncbi:class I SAM-dependent methyltransferase [Gorillibacterium massiliense]|uniref:class I SAM-dependent methyltransferase n=1 Tax=Gorillibacterium massiliense TaxID=1280390 RepID=UPI0005941411|nr:class I SAM-dependent methyltransferase [Gorillibacterium massiliense]
MSEELIGNVKLNYSYYKGSDLYSDGDIEDQMLEIARNYEDCEAVLAEDSRWPILYHFSTIRQNILEWFPFKRNAEVLEIGAGCGAVTGALLKNDLFVTCIELSKKRSMINAFRHKNYENLEIIVGNFNDIEITKKYDYITLVGVLEYAKLYIDNKNNPYLYFLKKIKEYLKEDGKLFIAIENKFGLKYWSGAKEDHTGILFDGIEGYTSNNSAETFSKTELKTMLYEAGLHDFEFYYPYPDYKFPLQIYSDKRLPQIGDLVLERYNYDQDKLSFFDEKSVYDNLINSQMYDFFSNSFLIVIENKTKV